MADIVQSPARLNLTGTAGTAGTATAPTVKTGTLDVIATQHPPAAAVGMNSQILGVVLN